MVDDHFGFRTFVGGSLEASGFKVMEAATGAEAVAVAHGSRPDLVLLDVQLPDLDGFKVAELLGGTGAAACRGADLDTRRKRLRRPRPDEPRSWLFAQGRAVRRRAPGVPRRRPTVTRYTTWWLGVAVAGAAVTADVLSAYVNNWPGPPAPAIYVVTPALVGFAYLATGLVAWRWRPAERIGLLFLVVGFLWYLPQISRFRSSVPFTFGNALDLIYQAALAQPRCSPGPPGT